MTRRPAPRTGREALALCLLALLAWIAVVLAAHLALALPVEVLLGLGLHGSVILLLAFWPGGSRRR